jgi:transcriptional regulator with XRE-family HTH domain
MKNKKSTAADWFAQLGERLRADGRLQVDEAKLELSEQIFQAMEAKGITEAELARRLKVSRAYVNKILQGATNFTIETLVKIGLALDHEFSFKFVDNNKVADIVESDVIYVEMESLRSRVPQAVSPLYWESNRSGFNYEEFNVSADHRAAVSAPTQDLALIA